MSKISANFQVDPKLAELLGESYKSTEDAIKELIDNAYDADAENIWVTMPDVFAENAVITIIDDGTGMKEQELISEYLKIASSRLSRKGERTALKGRIVKGRKGIGKFSGLMVAEVMQISTQAGGKKTELSIIKEHLSKEKYDLEKVNLPVSVEGCDPQEHGTSITLRGLNQNYNYPNPEKLKQILVWDYGRMQGLNIFVNEEKIGIQDFQGKTVSRQIQLSNGSIAELTYTISDKNVKQPGILYRVANKIVGRPVNFLKDDEIIPEKLKKRIVGELICDDLEEFITADWGAIIENSKINDEIAHQVKTELSEQLDEVYKAEMHLARLRYNQKIQKELAKLPDFKRSFAEKSLFKVIEKFYGEPEDKINAVISVMIDALEKDHYWAVINDIERARNSDVERFAEALSEFGLLEMSIISNQAINRLKFLDELELLVSNPNTLESTIHKSLENNLWVLGSSYSIVSSNKTLAKIIDDYLNKRYTGDRADKRPDLFLATNMSRNYTLVEFKRPLITIGRDAERQALEYRDDLNAFIHSKKMEIIVIGGKVNPIISSHNERVDVKLLSYLELISDARNDLNWLIEELKSE